MPNRSASSDPDNHLFQPDFNLLPDRNGLEARATARVLAELTSTPASRSPRSRVFLKDKWLLSSATQKCIRLGDAGWAVHVADALHSIDPEYLPKRLPIIALEDIGIADVELCFDVLYLCGGKKFRGPPDAKYQSAVLRSLVSRLAGAVKSRAACDAFCLGLSHAATPDMMTKLLSLDTEGLVAIATDRSRSMLKRINSLRVLAGISVREGGQYRTLSSCQPDSLRQVADVCGAPPIITYLSGQARRTSGLAAMLPIVYELIATETRIPITTGTEFPHAREQIHGVPACAFDMFSEVGRNAIAQFMNDAGPVKKFIAEKANTRSPLRLLNMALFHAETSKLNRFIAADSFIQLTLTTEQEEMREHGLIDPDDRHRLYALLADHSPVLHKARLTTARGLDGLKDLEA